MRCPPARAAQRFGVRDRARSAGRDQIVGARAAGNGEHAAPEPRATRAVISAPDAKPASTTRTASASAAMIRLRAGNCPPRGGVPGAYSEMRPPRRGDVGVQRGVAIGIDDVDAAAEHRERRAARVERAPMRGRVDPERAARDNRESVPRRRRRELVCEPGLRRAKRPARRRPPGGDRRRPGSRPTYQSASTG